MKDFKDMTAVEIKDRGNAYFAKKQYESAINCYTNAIVSKFRLHSSLVLLYKYGLFIVCFMVDSR